MTAAVIEVAERRQVEQSHRQRAGDRGRDLSAQPGEEPFAIGQLGQRIPQTRVSELGTQAAPVGDIGAGQHIPVAAIGQQRRHDRLHHVAHAVTGDQRHLVRAPVSGIVRCTQQQLRHIASLEALGQFSEVTSHVGVGIVSEHRQDRRRLIDDPAVPVQNGHQILGVTDECGEPCAAGTCPQAGRHALIPGGTSVTGQLHPVDQQNGRGQYHQDRAQQNQPGVQRTVDHSADGQREPRQWDREIGDQVGP